MDIAALIKKRDESGLSMLYDKYAASLLGIIIRIVKSRDVGEEILQQTLLKAWNNINTYKEDKGSLFTWLSTIARNTSIDQIRLKKHQNQQDTLHLDDQTKEPSFTIATESIDVAKILGFLDQNQKEVLDLLYLQGYTQSAAAERLNIPLGTVKTRLRLAIRSLRDELKDEKNLFFGSVILLILLMLSAWI